MFVLRSLIFIASAAGWLMLLNKKFSIKMEFAPAIYCSGCVSLLFLGGLLNALPETAVLITAGGLVCSVGAAWKKTRFSGRTWGVAIGFCLVLMYFAWLLKGTQFTWVDSYSHWGLAIREMLLENWMPNFTNKLIAFQAYPMGSTLWVYYVCHIIGGGEEWFLAAQQAMLLSCMLPLFVWVTKEKWYLAALPVCYAVYAMCSNIPITELMVDSLLPVVAVALFCIAIFYQDDKKKAVWCAAPILTLLLQVKNSGVFFAVIFAAYFALIWRKELLAQKKLGMQFLALDVLVPFTSLFLWHRHVKYVSDGGQWSYHAMTSESMSEVYADKSAEEIRYIFAQVWRSAGSPQNATFWLMLILTAVLAGIILYGIYSRKEWKNWAALLVTDWAFFALYVMGMVGTYVFSMTGDEATGLAAFERYQQTFGIFIYGFNTIQIMRYGKICKIPVQRIVAVICIAVSLLPFLDPSTFGFRYRYNWELLLRPADDSATAMTAIRQHKADFGEIPDGMSFYVYVGGADVALTRMQLAHRLRYEYRTPDVMFVGDLEEVPEETNFLYIWNSDEASDAFLRENGLPHKCGKSGVIVNLMSLG